LAGLLGLFLVIGFFAAHQAWSTGFFTTGFGLLGTVLFYAVLLTGLVPPVLGSLHLEKKRELEALLVTAVFWTMAAAWFFFAFPFNFSHLTAVVPSQASFILSWITDDVGRILVGVSLVGAAGFIPFYLLQFAGLRHHVTST
jgi:hypothetical protein